MSHKDQAAMAQKIRAQYTAKEQTQMDTLRALDSKVKRPANIFAYVFGSIGAIIMGCGMSLIMTDIASMIGISGNPMIPGIAVGAVGLFLSLINYPIYRGIIRARKKKYAERILTLSDEIMNQK